MPTAVTPPTVAFSVRSLRADLRDRLHALAAIREAQLGKRVTLEQVVNEALDEGIQALELAWMGPKVAAKLAAIAKSSSPPTSAS